MAAITSTAGSQAASRMAWQQLSLQQARQNAGRAEQVARSLQERAAEAQQVAARARENARSLAARADQAQTAAGHARQGLAAIRSVGEMQRQLLDTVIRVSKQPDVAQVAGGSGSLTVEPVVNTSGQVTGTVVNTTA
ncbi:MAG: hypothetical protein Q8L93_09185 [Rhodocyclaceae bacterium]|nr:hypothetical protein [Rhodocyclaceae bacterium]MDP1956858.1 hypothetical protein [Rhodocyclaceae bacterium]